MNKQRIIDELVAIAERLDEISNECTLSLKGYSVSAAEVAALAVHLVIDLVRIADEVSEVRDEDHLPKLSDLMGLLEHDPIDIGG
jgi:hypothetical protein